MVSGFEEYVTGYPLIDASFYAFARTWYAPEMERPGCVWTHTLLIGERDLGALDDLTILNRCFRRPTTGERSNWDEYRVPLKLLDTEPESMRPSSRGMNRPSRSLFGGSTVSLMYRCFTPLPIRNNSKTWYWRFGLNNGLAYDSRLGFVAGQSACASAAANRSITK